MSIKKISAIVIFSAMFALNAYADEQTTGKYLNEACKERSGTTILNQRILNYNVDDNGVTNFKIGSGWQYVTRDSSFRIHDFVKVAMLIGTNVDICLSGSNGRVMMIERTVSLSE